MLSQKIRGDEKFLKEKCFSTICTRTSWKQISFDVESRLQNVADYCTEMLLEIKAQRETGYTYERSVKIFWVCVNTVFR